MLLAYSEGHILTTRSTTQTYSGLRTGCCWKEKPAVSDGSMWLILAAVLQDRCMRSIEQLHEHDQMP